MSEGKDTFATSGLATRRVVVAAAAVIGGTAAILLAWWLMVPASGVLFANLAPRDLMEIVRTLDRLSIDHETDPETGTVRVDRDSTDRIRLALAREGVPDPEGAGYATRQASSFRVAGDGQDARAAQEADLAATIASLDVVRGARVSLGSEGAESATVILDPTGGTLPEETAATIRNLVAGAVPGLSPEGVALVDTSGAPLASASGARGNRPEARGQAVEAVLATRAENLVRRIVGAGNARVEVTADLKFASRTRTAELLDPNGQVLTSSTTSYADGGDLSNQSNSYETSRTTETETVEEGVIERLTVAVLVNSDALGGGEASEETLSRIADLVKDGTGLDEARGDRITVTSLPFAETSPIVPAGALTPTHAFPWQRLLELAGLALVILGVLAILARLLRHGLDTRTPQGRDFARIQSTRQGISQTNSARMPAPGASQQAMAGEGAVQEAELGHDVARLVQEHPDRAVALVRGWLNETERT